MPTREAPTPFPAGESGLNGEGSQLGLVGTCWGRPALVFLWAAVGFWTAAGLTSHHTWRKGEAAEERANTTTTDWARLVCSFPSIRRVGREAAASEGRSARRGY
jgi:hypothetical protein